MSISKKILSSYTIILFTSLISFLPYKALAVSSNLPTTISEVTLKQLENVKGKEKLKQKKHHDLLTHYNGYRHRHRRRCGDYGCG